MQIDSNRNLTTCVRDCEQDYRECLREGKEDVFCRIQRAPCDSECNEQHAA